MKDFVEYIVKQLVDYPDQVNVTEVIGEDTTICELEVAKEDMGKVIGKHGRTITAIRLLLAAAAKKGKRHCSLELLEKDN
jgi:uncharacterized protein